MPVEGVDTTVGKWKWAVTEDGSLSIAANHVAVILSLYFDKDGTCKPQYAPSITKLATRSRRKRDTVIAALRELTEKGWLRVVRRGTAKAHASLYRLTQPVPAGGPVADTQPVPLQGPVTQEGPVPLEASTSPSTGVNQSLYRDSYTTQPPDLREGGGGEVLRAPGADAPVARTFQSNNDHVDATTVLAAIVAKLPKKAEVQTHVLIPAIEAALVNGATVEQIVGASTSDLPRRPHSSWTGLLTSRVKGARDWVAPPDPVAGLRQRFDEMGHQIADDKEATRWLWDKLERVGLVNEDRDIVVPEDQGGDPATVAEMQQALDVMEECHRRFVAGAAVEDDEPVHAFELQCRECGQLYPANSSSDSCPECVAVKGVVIRR